jgi:hypothetical protein
VVGEKGDIRVPMSNSDKAGVRARETIITLVGAPL